MEKTINLSWFPRNIDELIGGLKQGSLMARVLSSCVIYEEGIGYFYHYNSHIDYGVESIQRRQMEEIIEEIDKNNENLKLPIVLTIDSNAKPDSDNMKFFTEELAKRGIYTPDLNDNTYKGNPKEGPKQVDYIFASSNFDFSTYDIDDNPNSDHYALGAVLKIKRK